MEEHEKNKLDIKHSFSNELYHYGRLGMHWGARNGPPYPLTKSAMSSEMIKKDPTSYAEPKSETSQKQGLTDKQKRNLKIGAGIAAGTIGAIAVGKAIKSNKKKAGVISNLSNDDLKSKIDRLKLEKEYLDLSSKSISQGQNFVENLMLVAGTTAVSSFVTSMSKKTGEAATAGILNETLPKDVYKAVYPKK